MRQPGEGAIPRVYDAAGRVLLALPFLSAGVVRLARSTRSIEELAGAGLAFPAVLNYAFAAVELAGGMSLALGYRVWAAAVALIVYLLPLTFLVNVLPAHEHPSQLLRLLRDLAVAGGLVLAAGLHRRPAGDRPA